MNFLSTYRQTMGCKNDDILKENHFHLGRKEKRGIFIVKKKMKGFSKINSYYNHQNKIIFSFQTEEVYFYKKDNQVFLLPNLSSNPHGRHVHKVFYIKIVARLQLNLDNK